MLFFDDYRGLRAWLRSVGLLVLVGFSFLHLAAQEHSQSVLVRYTTRQLAPAAYTESPYRLREPAFQQVFTRRLLADALRGRLQFYSDTAFARPVDGRRLDGELYFVRAWLRNRPQAQAMQLPNYQTEIYARELWFWQGDSLVGFDRQYIRIDIFDAAKPELAPLRYYLKPTAFEALVPTLVWQVDWCGNRRTGLLELWQQHDLVFDLPEQPHLPPAWAANWSVKLESVRRRLPFELRPVQLVIPSGWHDLSYKPGWSVATPQRLERSRHLVRVLAPQLIRLILLADVPVYTSTGQRDPTARARLIRLIETHAPGSSPALRRNARRLDYSAQVFDLEVAGRWWADASQQRFIPERLSLVWGQRIDDPNKEVVATFRFSDLQRKRVRVDGQPVDAALADWSAYYSYLFGVNDRYIQSLQQAAVIEACLLAGQLQSLRIFDWKSLNDEQLRPLLESCRRSR